MIARTDGRSGTREDVERLVRTVDRLLDRVGHWTASRWAVPASPVRAGIPTGQPADPGTPTRARVAHGLVQELADLGAGVEARAVRPVPRLRNDLVLPDQIRVTLRDLVAADPPPGTVADALAAVERAERSL